MRQNFDRALAEILRHEGGYVDHPADPGGATNLGITHITLREWRGRPVTKAEVRALTEAEAGQIYRARFWNAVKADSLPHGVDLLMFDGAVNHGPTRMIRLAQEALGLNDDGVLGPITLSALSRQDAVAVVKALATRRRRFYRGLRHFSAFGRGWMRRIDDVERVSLAWARAAIGQRLVA